MHNVVWILALGFAGWAGWLDWRTRRIPNWLTVSACLAGIVFNSIVWHWAGTKIALEGGGLALGVLLPFVLVRGLGAGDWKLMGGLGAWLGPSNLVLTLLATVVVAGIMAVVVVLRSRRIKETLANIWALVLTFITFGTRPNTVTLDNAGLLTIPFGTAAAVAITMLFCGEWAYRLFWL
jgi:prepilin peptidase CpaA